MEELYSDVEDTSFTCPNTYKSDRDWEKQRKAARFYVKVIIGIMVGLAKGKRFRWWVLTESDESIAAGLNFSHSWSMMRKWLARLDEQLEFCIVEHIQGDGMRRNWHVLTYGDNKLPVDEMRKYWKSHFLSTITGLQEVKYPFKSASYLAGYLGKDDKFVRARFSQNWVFPYWWDFGRFFKKEHRIYVPNDELVRLSLVPFEERRETNYWFDVYMDVRKYGWKGVFKMNNEKWEYILGRDIRNKQIPRKNINNDDYNQYQMGLWN